MAPSAGQHTAVTNHWIRVGKKWLRIVARGRITHPHARMPDMVTSLQAGAVIPVTCLLLGIVALPGAGLTAVRVPVSVVILDSFLTLTAAASPRMVIRMLATWQQGPGSNTGRRALIAGAGAAGLMIMKEMLTNPQLGLTPVGF